MKEVINYILAYAPNIIAMFVSAIVGVLGITLRNLANKYCNSELKRTIAKDVVQAVEQIFRDLHGKDKFYEAADMLRVMLEKNGIDITEDEMEMLIESAVNEFNRNRTE